MEVSNGTFLDAVEKIKASIDRADFVAVDFELSGLHLSKDEQPSALDGSQEYFTKLRGSAQNAVLQFGLCCFRLSADGGSRKQLVAEPYNIYVAKRPFRNKFCNDRFVFQAESIDFLSNCKFDYNKCFREGVSYLNQQEAGVVREWLARDREEIEERGLLRQREKEEKKVDLSRLRNNDLKFLKELKSNIDTLLKADSSKPNYFLVPSSNSYLRRIAFQVVADTSEILHVGKFPKDNQRTQNQFRNNATLRVTKCRSIEAVKELEQERVEETLRSSQNETQEAIGIGLLVDFLLAKKAPLIGHNCLLDLLHMHHKFVKPLNEDLEAFREDFHADFPHVFDTKWILTANSNRLCSDLQGRTFLSRAYETVRKHSQFQSTNPLVRIDVSSHFKRYRGLDRSISRKDLEHEAGYDAFMTGVLYACMKERTNLRVDNLANCLNVMRSSHCIRLDIRNAKIDKEKCTIRLVDFPRKTKAYDIQKLFRSELEVDAKAQYVTFESDTSALVTLDNSKQVDRILNRAAARSLNTSDHRRRLAFSDFTMYRYSSDSNKRSSSAAAEQALDTGSGVSPARKKRRLSDAGKPAGSRWECQIA